MNKLHYIHSRGGRIGGRSDTAAPDVDRIVAALAADPRRHLILHFHGGLVSKSAGLDIAQALTNIYSPTPTTGGYPVFYVWESGAWETIRNNLTELADEPVFRQLLRKCVQYALEKLGLVDPFTGARAVPTAVGGLEDEVRTAFNAFWASPSSTTIPYRDGQPPHQTSRSATLNALEIEADLEQDRELQRALSTLPNLPPGTRNTLAQGNATQERPSAFAEVASYEFSKESGTRGLVSLAAVAALLVRVVIGVISRYRSGRDHGVYATCVEELVRAFKLAASSVNEWGKALQWNRMKQDTVDAFEPDPDIHAGTALLARLSHAMKSGLDLRRITLVGHSTGAIYIANWLEHAARFLPDSLKQDVVFLAPAITYERFAQTLHARKSTIGRFQMFAMSDALERVDQVWGSDSELNATQDWRRYLYPSSLLYLVSGLLESQTLEDGRRVHLADAPLLGMQRYFADERVYDATKAEFAAIGAVRDFLKAVPGRLVWSRTTDAEVGLGSNCEDHGGFDNEPETLASLRHIVS